MGIAVAGGALANAAFVARYTSVVFPLFVLLAALGLTVFADRRMAAGMLGVACVAGLLTGYGNNQQSAPRPSRWPPCSTSRRSPATKSCTAPTSSARRSTAYSPCLE